MAWKASDKARDDWEAAQATWEQTGMEWEEAKGYCGRGVLQSIDAARRHARLPPPRKQSEQEEFVDILEHVELTCCASGLGRRVTNW